MLFRPDNHYAICCESEAIYIIAHCDNRIKLLSVILHCPFSKTDKHIIFSGGSAELFRERKSNIMASDALAPYVARSSAVPVLTV